MERVCVFKCNIRRWIIRGRPSFHATLVFCGEIECIARMIYASFTKIFRVVADKLHWRSKVDFYAKSRLFVVMLSGWRDQLTAESAQNSNHNFIKLDFQLTFNFVAIKKNPVSLPGIFFRGFILQLE